MCDCMDKGNCSLQIPQARALDGGHLYRQNDTCLEIRDNQTENELRANFMVIAKCQPPELEVFGRLWNKEDVGFWVVGFDMLVVLIFLITIEIVE